MKKRLWGALVLVCLMMTTQFIGIVDPPFIPSSGNSMKVDLVNEYPTLPSDEMEEGLS